ncbi:MAG: sulfatase-like hydrolase/transferase, partial [Kiritimatiellales bacterium]
MKLSSLCMAGSVIAAAGMAENQAPRPNIIYILLDDLGWGDVGFNGQEKIKTPVLDQLAAQGAVFNNYYTGSTVCTPSRVCLLTGMHTGHSVIRNNSGWSATRKGRGLDADGVTVARELQQAGYATACIGKWGLGSKQSHPLKQGFDEFWGFISHGEAHFHWPGYVWHGEEKVDLGGVKNWEEKRV